MNAQTSDSHIPADTCKNDQQLSPDEFNLRSILAHITMIRQRLDLLRLEGKLATRHIQAAKTGLIVTETAIEELLR